MQIIISGKNLMVSDLLKNYVDEKLGAVLQHPNLKITSARVVLEIEKIRNIVEITVNMKNHVFETKTESLDMYESIDAAVGKINSQIDRLLDRVQDHGRKAPLRDVITDQPEN